MNNQSVKAFWRLVEDSPTSDSDYLVAFEDEFGEFRLENCSVWSFKKGNWYPIKEDNSGRFPVFYIDLTMPKLK